MEDREPLYPGRIKLTPVSGQANVYDSVRADQPVKAGSPLNKNTFLKDTTAALFGKTSAALPDEIFQILANAALYKNGEIVTPGGISVPNVQIEIGSYVGTGTYGADNPSSITFQKKPVVVFIRGNSNSFAIFLPTTLTNVYSQYGYWGASGSSTAIATHGYAKYSEDNELSWYSTDNRGEQMNGSNNLEYYYIALCLED